jgi:hypothetical protein
MRKLITFLRYLLELGYDPGQDSVISSVLKSAKVPECHGDWPPSDPHICRHSGWVAVKCNCSNNTINPFLHHETKLRQQDSRLTDKERDEGWATESARSWSRHDLFYLLRMHTDRSLLVPYDTAFHLTHRINKSCTILNLQCIGLLTLISIVWHEEETSPAVVTTNLQMQHQ